MLRFLQYYGRFNDVRGQFGGLPGWARGILLIAAIPGLVLLALSLLAVLVSILALLLLTLPVYRLLTAIVGPARPAPQPATNPFAAAANWAAGSPDAANARRHVDVRIIE